MAKASHVFGVQIKPDGGTTVLLSDDHGMTDIPGIMELERQAAERPSGTVGQKYVLTGKIDYPDLDFSIEEDDDTFRAFISSRQYGEWLGNRNKVGTAAVGDSIVKFDYMISTVTPDDSEGIRRLNVSMRINGDVTYKTAEAGDLI